MPRPSQNLESCFKGDRERQTRRWKLEATTNGENFITLFEAPNPTYLGNELQQFEVDTVHKYNCYRLFCLEAEPSNLRLSYMHHFIQTRSLLILVELLL